MNEGLISDLELMMDIPRHCYETPFLLNDYFYSASIEIG
jgi:hypothetical protein